MKVISIFLIVALLITGCGTSTSLQENYKVEKIVITDKDTTIVMINSNDKMMEDIVKNTKTTADNTGLLAIITVVGLFVAFLVVGANSVKDESK